MQGVLEALRGQQVIDIDTARNRFDELCQIWQQNPESIENEQDTRFQIIDRVLTEVLGWNHEEVSTEKSVKSGYIDYLLKSEDRNRLVIEAKKASTILIDTKDPKRASYKVGGSALKSAQEGIDQASFYCSRSGVRFAGLTTGLEWIGFIAIRADGKSPNEGRAIVFPNLDSIKSDFAIFFDLFSKKGVLENLHLVRINEVEGLQVHYSERLHQVIAETHIRLLAKSDLSKDLNQVFSGFFSTMSGETDPDMLAKCFVESKESREADDTLSKITGNLVNQIDVVSPAKGQELQEEIRIAVETQRGEFVLIIGNKGAGKSTFIDRFFKLVLDQELRKQCLVIRVDLADSGGDLETITSWLNEQLKEKIEEMLFSDGSPTYEELQGVFFKEYRRWQRGEYKFLYRQDKNEFKIRFGEHVTKLTYNNPEKYINYLLLHSIRSRRLMPCLVFDNTDHFPQRFQEQVFQFAQSIHRGMFSFVICPITDRTIWQLSKSGPLQSYATKSFYLPIPSTKEILTKRVQFIREKLDDEPTSSGRYFLKKGIRLTIKDIQAFASCIENILITTDYISRIVSWISNHDIRRSLQISQRIVTSPVLKIEQLVKTYLLDNPLSIKRHQIKKALIHGDYSHFSQDHSDFVLNLFSVRADQITSPLVKLSILRMFSDRENQYQGRDEAYLTVDDLQNYFEPTGLSNGVVRTHLQELLDYRLVVPYDPTEQHVYEEQRLKIDHSGRIHIEFCLSDETYVSQMALVTKVRNYDLVSKIREIRKSKLARTDWLHIISVFMVYCLDQDSVFMSIPSNQSYDGQSQLRQELKMRWIESLEEAYTVTGV